MHREHKRDESIKPKYTVAQKFYRAIFMGSLIALVVFLGKTLDVFWGGIFAVFPAATFSALIFLHFNYPVKELFSFMKKAPIGSISLFVYAISAMVLFPIVGIVMGSLGAYLLSLVSSLVLIKFSR